MNNVTVETLEAKRDIRQFIKYILEHFHSEQAAMHLIEMYDGEKVLFVNKITGTV